MIVAIIGPIFDPRGVRAARTTPKNVSNGLKNIMITTAQIPLPLIGPIVAGKRSIGAKQTTK